MTPNLARYQVRAFVGKITLRGWTVLGGAAFGVWFWWKVAELLMCKTVT